MKKTFIYLSMFLLPILINAGIYFPPINGSEWEKVSLKELNWDSTKITDLYTYLESVNSKGFMVIKDGKIIIEKYFDSFTQDSTWYWASAGKTLTAFLIGRAKENGKLNIYDKSSKYLGTGWTACTQEQEDKITIWNQLTMTSGLNDKVDDNHCTNPECLEYLAEPGTRWAYHNAVYTLLETVIEKATNTKINLYTYSQLKSKIGMSGIWTMLDYDNIFISNMRSMARFGLLISNHCIWETDTLLKDNDYYNQMLNTSQELNKSYGYLWWLNGKESFMLPVVQHLFSGAIAPQAPADMYSALGKNGQLISIAPSLGIVLIRIGEAPDVSGSEVSNQLLDNIWSKLNPIIRRGQSSVTEIIDKSIYPNPAVDGIRVSDEFLGNNYSIYNTLGEKIAFGTYNGIINIKEISVGYYLLSINGRIYNFYKSN